jgi:hypothetical protein
VIARALAVALALSAGMAAAQDAQEGPRRGGRPREEIFRLIDEHVARSLQERVGLSDDQAARALPLVQRLHADRRRFAARRIRAMQQMRRAFRPGAPAVGDARAAEMLQELKAAEADEAAGLRAGQDAVDAVLTPLQQVKYRIFETEMEHRLRELMARVRAQRRGENGGRRRGPRPRGESPAPQ